MEIRDGDKVVATEFHTLRRLPPFGERPAEDVLLLTRVVFADGQSLTWQPDNSWLTEKGQRLKQVITELEESECATYAVYQLAAW